MEELTPELPRERELEELTLELTEGKALED
jgi:hypothetical protein